MISATIGDLPPEALDAILARATAVGGCGVDLVKVGVPGRGAASCALLAALAALPLAIVPVLIADDGLDAAVIDAACAVIDNPAITIMELIENHIPGPDFPTGAFIVGRDGIQDGYRTGRGKVVMRARTHFEETEKGGRVAIVIDELPYQVNKANLLMKIGIIDEIAGKLNNVADCLNCPADYVFNKINYDAHCISPSPIMPWLSGAASGSICIWGWLASKAPACFLSSGGPSCKLT